MSDSDSGDDFDSTNGRRVGGSSEKSISSSCNNTTGNISNGNNQKCKRRIVMRIEFGNEDDSDESTSSNGHTTGEEFVDKDLDMRPSCSTQRRYSLRTKNTQLKQQLNQQHEQNDNEFTYSATRRLLNRRINDLNVTVSHSDNDGNSSTSGSEVNSFMQTRSKKIKTFVNSEEELQLQTNTSNAEMAVTRKQSEEEAGFNSDSSSNELLEKCPICLFTFRQQEIGSPAVCAHYFCATCIEAWSKNVQTCPIDRLEFDKIVVRKSFECRKILREININPKMANKELTIDNDIETIEFVDNDVTNCEICNSPEREDVMLLCDSCNQGYHIDCLDPPLNTIPEGSWYCDNCFDSNDESDGDNDVAEDLNMLYEDIRDMGIPQTRLRVREVQQPRILRTRQNERIRAEVLRRTRSNMLAQNLQSTTLTRTTMQRCHSSSNTTMTTLTTMRTSSGNKCNRSKRRVENPFTTSGRCRRRRTRRHRTYIVEYDVANNDEKFAIKTKRKIIKRRRRKVRSSRSASNERGVRLTASQRLAEQLGIKVNHTNSRWNNNAVPSLSLFGNSNDLEYFSDSDVGGNDHISSEIRTDGGGGGTAVQTSVRIGSFGATHSRKALLFGKLQKSAAAASSVAYTATPDILSSIMDMQDRWHNATRNMNRVHIATDGSLGLPLLAIRQSNKVDAQETRNVAKPAQNVTEMPMYPRGDGGGGPKFNTSRGNSGGGGGVGGNNRYGNTSSYSGGSADSNQYQRYSTGGMLSNNNANGGFSNQSLNNNSNNLNSGNNSNQILNFPRFNMRFNPRNHNQNQRNNNQRHSLTFTSQRNDNRLQQQHQQPAPPAQTNHSQGDFLTPPLHMQSYDDSNQLFAGLPAPTNQMPPPPVITAVPGVLGAMPPVLSVPPPPAPPPSLQPWSNSLFKLNSDYSNEQDDTDSNCPNFSVYSQESQAVATMSSTTDTQTNAVTHSAKDDSADDINEDLVQLDDDDDIPMPLDEPETNASLKATNNATYLNLYEPENPTDGIESDNDDNDKCKDSNDRPTQNKLIKSNESSIITGAAAGSYNPQEVVDDRISNDVKTNKDHKQTEKNFDSPTSKHLLLNERGVASESRKGVLELYDDSDWEELDIDRQIIKEKTVEQNSTTSTTAVNDAANTTQTTDIQDEPDRSYTPCLDENNEEEQNADEVENILKDNTSTVETPLTLTGSDTAFNKITKEPKKASEQERVGDIETELITEDEATDNDDSKRRSRSRRRNKSKLNRERSKRGERNNVGEAFKKVGQRQKGRNYRTDKQQSIDRRRRTSSSQSISHSKSLSRSKSRLRTRSRSRSRSKSRSNVTRSRSRSRTRSPPCRRRTRSKSFSRTSSRSHSPFQRGRRQFNKENYRKFRGNGGNYSRGGRFNQTRNMRQYNYGNSYRLKRRELPRYDVRNVIGQSQRSYQKDRYGRDTTRQFRDRSSSFSRRSGGGGGCGRDNSHSCSRSSRSHSRQRTSNSPKRGRSFSISPSPQPQQGGVHYASLNRLGSLSPRRFGSIRSPLRHVSSQQRRFTPLRERSNSSGVQIRSRSITPQRIINRKVDGCGGKRVHASPTATFSPRYTPRLSRSCSKSPKKSKKKKKGAKKLKKKKQQRAGSASPIRNRRILRQRDPFNETDDLLQLQHSKRRASPNHAALSSAIGRHRWSPSLSLSPPHLNLLHDSGDKNASWTPPLRTPTGQLAPINDFLLRSGSAQDKTKEKRKRAKAKKKKLEKREIRKEKRRKRQRTQTPELQPSKEVFASGNNILVSVSFNKEASSIVGGGGGSGGGVGSALLSQSQQTTVVTLPATREDLLSNNRRLSNDGLNTNSIISRSRTRKRKKLEAKPVAIIDLERSPFQVQQLPADVIVLTDSEDTNENITRRIERSRRSTSEVCHDEHDSRDRNERDRDDHHRMPMANSHVHKTHDKSLPSSVVERLEPILDASYDNLTPPTNAVMASTGPKTPPEPPIVKFQLPAKKSHKLCNNPLHDEADDDDLHSDIELDVGNSSVGARETHEVLHATHESNMGSSVVQKIGPNTPPESGPCSPDAYDPFEPTKSPSLSPRSPMPPPNIDTSQTSLGADSASVDSIHQTDRTITQKHNDDMVANSSNVSVAANVSTNALNPVDLVMALMNSKSANTADISANKAGENQYANSNNHIHNSNNIINSTEDKSIDESQERNSITVLSNVLLSNSVNAQAGAAQHIPVISSPTPPSLAKKLAQLSNNKPGSSIASSGSGINLNNPSTNERTNVRNGSSGDNIAGMDDSFNMDIESPYSPGSADYEDLFEPPPENPVSAIRRNKRSGKTEMFDNLFGSSSPIGQHRMSNLGTGAIKKSTTKNKYYRKSKVKVGKSDDHIKVYDDVLSSAVEQQVKDKFLRKLNRQERVVEEVKHVLKPFFNKKSISKDDYKEIMRRAVPKICHSRSGEINPHKIKNLIDAYVKKFRAKHKKLNPINTGQVSSAVKCAAYLKKL